MAEKCLSLVEISHQFIKPARTNGDIIYWKQEMGGTSRGKRLPIARFLMSHDSGQPSYPRVVRLENLNWPNNGGSPWGDLMNREKISLELGASELLENHFPLLIRANSRHLLKVVMDASGFTEHFIPEQELVNESAASTLKSVSYVSFPFGEKKQIQLFVGEWVGNLITFDIEHGTQLRIR